MTYIISDIHGEIEAFKLLLDEVLFDETKDKLIVLGDVIDRGRHGLEIIDYLMPMIKNGSATMLLGNHELFAIYYLENRLEGRFWSAFGGDDTLRQVKKLDDKQCEELHDFLIGLPLYTELHSEIFGDVVCTHTGLDVDYLVRKEDGNIDTKKSIEQAYDKNQYSYMCGMDIHYMKAEEKRALDKFMIVGHTPCYRLNEDCSCTFYRTAQYMCIDAGSGHKAGMLGLYVLETDEEIYVEL